MKRVLAVDLIKKGASTKMAQSYVMSLDNEDLTRVKENQVPDDDPRF